MPQLHRRPFIPLVPLASLALAATACSALSFGDRTEAYEFVSGTAESSLCTDGDDLWFLDRPADLVGPHFAVSILCHFEGAEVPESLADLPELADLPPAADDVDLLVNQFALAPDLTPESQLNPEDAATVESAATDLRAWVDAGDERFDLDEVPAGGAYFAVSVPSGEDAVLWVEEAGRAQGLNLRTGEPVDPVPAYYDGRSLEPVLGDAFEYEDVAVANGDEAWELTCGSDFVQTDRAAWRVAEGWAEAGTVFLEVQLNWCTFEEGIRWHLAEEGALTLDSGAGAVAPLSWQGAELEGADGTMRYTAVFALPEDAAAATLTFTPVGNVENLGGGDDYAFADTPEPTERELAF